MRLASSNSSDMTHKVQLEKILKCFQCGHLDNSWPNKLSEWLHGCQPKDAYYIEVICPKCKLDRRFTNKRFLDRVIREQAEVKALKKSKKRKQNIRKIFNIIFLTKYWRKK
jgi:hypothetical protein